jgi:predicted AlkP superfamily phosphohydrolase/phosphomutase
MAMNTEMHGRVYLNVRGRNMKGCVEPGAEYDSIINALRERFLQVRNPATGEQIFAKVTTHRELYDCENADVEKLGDLILVPRKGYSLTRSISKKCTRIELCREDSLAGCHCHEGIYIISGPNVKAGQNKRAHIVDIFPTVYAVPKAKAPTYLDGNVLQDAFSQRLKVRYSSSEKRLHPPDQERQCFSDGEEKAIHQQLAGLGYID